MDLIMMIEIEIERRTMLRVIGMIFRSMMIITRKMIDYYVLCLKMRV